MSPGFVHLHVHSEYALTDSIIRIPDKPEYGDPATAPRPNLISHARRLGLPALALTDDSNLFALIKFYKAALANGIKPIVGCDLWLRHDGHSEARRLTLLCQDHAGYLNLSRLISRAWREGQQGGRATVAEHWLDGASNGLIALAGHASALAQSALADHADSALLQRLRQRFPERLYLELTRCGRAHEEDWIAAALALGARHDLPLLASNDARFLEREDFEAHEARVCIQQGRVLADPKRSREYSPEQYLKSAAAMRALFADLPEALDNSVELAKRCNLELHFGTYHLPAFPTPPGVTLEQHIRASSSAGLTQRLARHGAAGAHSEADYYARLHTELDVIVRMGFAGYFLIVADFINWAKRNDIPVGPGRGSGAGSVVAWALGITDLDPLQFGLLFERFLNPERVSMPDFDVDFCMDRRDEVIDYVARTYGRDQVSQIITYGTMAAKAVVRDAGRVLGHGYGFVDSIAKLIPNALGISLADALGESDEAAKRPDLVSAELVQRSRDEDEVRELLELARKLEDLVRNAGKHAGGVVIAPGPLTDYSPLYAEQGGGGLVTQFDKDDVEAVGLVKFDFLGLRTLTIIDWTVKAINARRAQAGEALLDITQLPLGDPAPYELLKHARTVAVFQFESAGMQRMLKEARPDRFEDIIALGALYRPGPMDLIPSFVARKHGREEVRYPDARVEPILRETYGIMVYQEQVMQMAQIVGGYSLGAADLLRRAMGKKNIEQMARERARFLTGAAANGVEETKADAIFDLMEKFAGYGFNKSHAAAYALVSYQTAWLKAHYPAEFMAATLSSDMEKTDKVVTFLDEARALGLSTLPPDVNQSAWMFVAVDARTIRHGLGALKGVGRAVSEAIADEAARQPFRDLGDLCRRVGSTRVNKRVLEALIQSGACDALDADRATLWAQIPDALKAAEQHARAVSAGQHGLFGDDDSAPEPLPRPRVPAWTLEQRLNGERAILGFYLSGHPTDAWRGLFAQLVPCALGEIAREWKPPEARNGRPAEVSWTAAGQVVDVRRRRDDLAIVQLEDASGSLEVIVAQEVLQETQALLVQGALLVIEGGLRMSEFGLGLRARRIHTLDDICRRRGRLLRVQVQGVQRGFAAALSSVLAAWRGGSTRVLLCGYRNAQGQADVLLDDTWAVAAHPDLLRALAQMPGVMHCELLLARGAEG
ncbi:DNA polymerase III subunit alpha [Metallibacterium sp.]|uniref:DNA polymerase III subunit alpha n=1 Tax=Metallibacterium sp. TaxID=2940281 RepID=UPI002629AADB|nr:DNA polymerase III subunit alpha [Metallibacterium sp.]